MFAQAPGSLNNIFGVDFAVIGEVAGDSVAVEERLLTANLVGQSKGMRGLLQTAELAAKPAFVAADNAVVYGCV